MGAELAQSTTRIAVIIPCYRVQAAIADVIADIGPEVFAIVCVDDACPDGSGDVIEAEFGDDPRVHLVRRPTNGGVGAATMTGYQTAIALGANILVKVDGDGQMDPRMLPQMVRPIVAGEADYVKGNRFYSAESVSQMPWVRLIGNAGLSFMTKLSTGYWDLFDPTNGYTVLEARVARALPFAKMHQRYFFETDMLFRLGVLRARVVEIPAIARYGSESSNLSATHALLTFPWFHLRNFAKRVVYNYFLRNFSIASMNLITGVGLCTFGVVFGLVRWWTAIETGNSSTAGTVMLAALPILLGIQLLLAFLSHDIQMTPSQPLHTRLSTLRVLGTDDD